MNSTERQPDESAQAYEAFRTYAEQGVGRSIRVAAERLGKSDSLLSRWASHHHWVERAADFDRRLETVRTEAEEKKVARSAGLWASRMEETREEMFRTAQKLVEKAEAMLAFPLAAQTAKDGKTFIKPCRWSFADAARMLETASRLKQLATGLPTERLEHSASVGTAMGGLAISVQDLEATVFDQMRREVLSDLESPKAIEQTEGASDDTTRQQ